MDKPNQYQLFSILGFEILQRIMLCVEDKRKHTLSFKQNKLTEVSH